jgi:hypothetical protein
MTRRNGSGLSRKAGRPWLLYSTGSEASPSTCKTMTCNYCITFSKVKGSSSATNSFIAGCDNFRIEGISKIDVLINVFIDPNCLNNKFFTLKTTIQVLWKGMTFAVFCFMVLWVLLIIEGINCEIIVLLFSYLKEKKHPQNCLFGKDIFTPKNPSDCRILHLDFQNFMGGMPPNPPIQLTP